MSASKPKLPEASELGHCSCISASPVGHRPTRAALTMACTVERATGLLAWARVAAAHGRALPLAGAAREDLGHDTAPQQAGVAQSSSPPGGQRHLPALPGDQPDSPGQLVQAGQFWQVGISSERAADTVGPAEPV